MYYNTTNEVNPQLKEIKKKTWNQDDKIFMYIKKAKTVTAWQIHEYFKNIPITSVRRSLNTLMNEGKIIKTNQKRLDFKIKQISLNTWQIKRGFVIVKNDTGFHIVINGNRVALIYVHTLQNLYFALTNKQLTK